MRRNRVTAMDRDRLYAEFVRDTAPTRPIKGVGGSREQPFALTADEVERRNLQFREKVSRRRDLSAEKREADIAYARMIQFVNSPIPTS